ncbi:hypothetical protein E3P99_01491 [Wallemia hederae]|uniref:Uncharacterized protein n=1 Tax=Wallemia hederae TaxID=1540922 RepID=A0A4T0FRG2_9BASI|nr:hypothetical protein E3P99_01491 [Wallemia hederae]
MSTMRERSNDDEITVAHDSLENPASSEPPAAVDRASEFADLAHLREHSDAQGDGTPEDSAAMRQSLIKVQQNCMLALNTLIFSTLSSIKPIISTDWRGVSERYTPGRNLRNLNNNVNYALQTHLHAATSGELGERIERMSYLFSPIDAKLVVALHQFAEVLMVLVGGDKNEKKEENDDPATPTSTEKPSSLRSAQRHTSPTHVYDSLQSQMSKLKLEMRANNLSHGDLWIKVETFINLINLLCSERENMGDAPPSYADLSPTQSAALSHKSVSASASTASIVSSVQDEKMRRDLERVTDSIDRLMRITPQLASQRVELTQKQVIEMDLAKLAGEVESSVKTSKAAATSTSASANSKQHNGVGKLLPKSIHSRRSDNNIINGIEKANSRRLDTQRVDMGSRLEDARSKMRDADLIDIVQRNRAGRMVGQDVAMPGGVDGFVGDVAGGANHGDAAAPANGTSHKATSSTSTKDSIDSQTRSLVAQQAYLAEHNVNVGNVLVQFKTQLHGTSKELEVEVDAHARDSVILKNLSNFNVRLKLPTRVVYPQRKTVRLVERDLFEFNLQVSHQSRKSLTTPVVEPPAYPYSAADFALTRPSSFRCAQCSRDLANGVYVDAYRDLPSDSWAEHVDNWMCHPAQELNADYYRDALATSAAPGEALVGSAYWVFHRKNVIDKSVRVEYTVSGRTAAPALPQVRLRLRRRLRTERGGVPLQQGVRAARRAEQVEAVSEDTPTRTHLSHTSSSFTAYNIGHYISAELVDQSRNYGTYRYFLQDEQSGELRLLVWLFNPLVKLRSSQVRLSSAIEACKLFWKTNREEPLRDSRMSSIAKLQYPAWVLDDLERALVSGIGAFLGDSPKRFFSDWHIGYIERVSK